MKYDKIKNALVTTSVLAATCYAGLAMGHNQAGSLTAGTAASASRVDYYQITCGTGTQKLQAQVKDASTADSTLLGIVMKKGFAVSSITDPAGGNAYYSTKIAVYGSTGVYDLYVIKTGLPSQSYDVLYHCLSSTGAHTSTSIVTRLNQ